MNIYDVAKLSKVSIATVSRVLNDSDKVSKKTKNKVIGVMEEYGYKPNVFARGLNLNSVKVVGILCPDIDDRYMAKGVSCLEKELRNFGYDCILMCTGYDYDFKVACVNSLIERRIDALILVGSNYAKDNGKSDVDYLKKAAEKMPIILINGCINSKNIYSVLTDNKKAVYDVTSRMIKKGKKNILFLYDSYSYSLKKKMLGYELAINENNLVQNKLFVPNDISKALRILEEKKIDFDGVIASEDNMAIAALKYSNRYDLKAMIVGFNNSDVCLVGDIELSSIDSRIEKLASMSVDTLIKVINNESVKKKQVIDCLYIERDTSKL